MAGARGEGLGIIWGLVTETDWVASDRPKQQVYEYIYWSEKKMYIKICFHYIALKPVHKVRKTIRSRFCFYHPLRNYLP